MIEKNQKKKKVVFTQKNFSDAICFMTKLKCPNISLEIWIYAVFQQASWLSIVIHLS